ncbi:MAG: aspartate 1-decarboxylase, partial [Caulobacteraceae bacterium]
GDKVIIVTYGMLPVEEARNYAPTVVLLDDANQIKTAA